MTRIQSFLNLIRTIQLIERFSCVEKGCVSTENNVGDPLFLTPYIERGSIEEAKSLAKVHFTEDNFNITSYSGFFTVNKEYNSNQFLWYFPPIEAKFEKNPVVVWLEGGPGISDMFSLFLQNGPLAYHNGNIEYREYNWARQNHVVYIDNPVGVGFSFTNDSRGYCTNQTQVGEQLYTTLSQFFTMFPELQTNPLIISGQSYGGKFVPALAYTIHKKNPTATVKMNLKVLHIGNAWIAPEHQVGFYNEVLYNIGLLDRAQQQQVKEYEDQWLNAIKNEQWTEGYNFMKNFLLNESGLLTRFTGYNNTFNLLHAKTYIDEREFTTIFDNKKLRKQIHVGNVTFNFEEIVLDYLKDDMMKSVEPWVEELLDHYYLSLYTGNLDIAVAYPLVENFLMNLKYNNGSNNYAAAERLAWTVDGETRGYVKQAGLLTHTVIRNSGHCVSIDQPKWAWELLLEVNKKFLYPH